MISLSDFIPDSIINLEHNHFLIKFKDDNLFFDVSIDLLSELKYSDTIPDRVNNLSLSYIDVLFSYEDNLQYAKKCCREFVLPEYVGSIEDQENLLMMIAYNYYIYRFSNMNSVFEIKEEVPAEIFIYLLSKEKDLEIVMEEDLEGNIYAGKLQRAYIHHSLFGDQICLEVAILSKGIKGYTNGIVSFYYSADMLLKNVEDLGFKVLDEKTKKILTKRGKRYVKYTMNPSYCFCNGFGFSPGEFWSGDIRFNATGRVIIDPIAMRLLNPDIGDRWYRGNIFNTDAPAYDEVDNDLLWMCSPVVYGFSMSSKTWGRMRIDDISDISFSKLAFDELIVPDKYKDIFVSCLVNDMPSLDEIDGKGNGKIFLLYGPPGCGKTMTAESVAEYLKLPLYYVSVGELGTTTSQLETNLKKAMEVATRWNAIILLDEIDVFASKRTDSDIHRNAMTAILLRMLERYAGTIFMTTNLIDNLDPAFISRATVRLKYDQLKSRERCYIWENLISKIKKLGITIDSSVSLLKLNKYNRNGREIKNALRLAYVMALKNDKVLTMDIIDSILELSSD